MGYISEGGAQIGLGGAGAEVEGDVGERREDNGVGGGGGAC